MTNRRHCAQTHQQHAPEEAAQCGKPGFRNAANAVQKPKEGEQDRVEGGYCTMTCIDIRVMLSYSFNS